MPVWNLPAFRENASFPQPNAFGHWMLADSSLRQLSASLKVDTNTFADPHEPVRAIPDPWAQARTFAEAVLTTDKGHPLRRASLAQWRGLLALFALRQFYPKDCLLEPVPFALDGDGMFDRVLTHLTPQIALGGQVDLWSRPLIFTLNGRAVAMGNPACLVSPGRLTADMFFESIPWFREGLRDPVACGLPVTQLFVLSSWLRQLRADLGSVTGEVAERVRQLLLEYSMDCDRHCGDLPLVASLGPSPHTALGEPYARLFATAKLGEQAQPWQLSRTRIRLDPALQLGQVQGVILVDRSLADDPRFDRRTTLVWGTRTLGELLDNAEAFRSTAAQAASQGWMIVSADDLFTPRVAQFENGSRIAGNPAGLEEMLVPLRPLALLLPGAVRDRVSGSVSGSKAVFTLRLTIEDGTEGGVAFDLSRHYGASPAPGEGLLVSDENWNIYHTALWPDFRSSAWNNYLLRFNYSDQNARYMVRPAHGLSPALVAAEAADQETGFSGIERLREINAGRQLTQKKDRWHRSERRTAGEFEDMQYSAVPFEAISYIDAFGDRADAPAGLALVNLPSLEPGGGALDVAIDFGTTNTVACLDDGEPMRFKDRIVYPLTFANPQLSAEALHSARWLVRKFFPPELRHTPTPTVALQRADPFSGEPHHAFRNLVYFHSHERHAHNAETEELTKFKRVRDKAKFNLKWSDDPEVAEAASDFLSQFVLMVAAEALAAGRNPRRIHWRFSIPDSLDGEMRENFENTLRRITRPISTEVRNSDEIVRDLYSEGLSAAEFILDGGAGFTRGSLNIVLDIGGGTTDISIWDDGPIRWIGSLRLAGQDFFTKTISQNPEILAQIGLGHWEALFKFEEGAIEGVSRKDIPHLAEMLFSGPALQEAIDEHWDSRLLLKTGKDLRLVAQTFIGGIAWYLGRIARKLVEDGKLREADLDNPAFALCGRGAGIFKKMHGGREADQLSQTTRALQVFAVAANLDREKSRPQLFTTPDAKLEVVRGMIASTGDKSRLAAEASRFYLAGLDLTMDNGSKVAAADQPKRASLTDPVRDVDLSELEAFLAALSECAGIEIDLRPDSKQGGLSTIQNEVKKSINDLRLSKDQKRELEPPFVTALRALIGMMAAPASKREAKLTMDYRT